MTTTPQPVAPPRPPGRGLPTWARFALGAVAVLAAVALLAAVFAPRGRVAATPTPAPTTPPTASPAPDGQTLADGCLGGRDDLDQAVLTAQQQAPLTEAGAAAFTATLMRWALGGPAAPEQAETATEILAADATDQTRLSGSFGTQGWTLDVDFTEGRYYIESLSETEAVVSWLAAGEGTSDGEELDGAWLGGTTHLSVVDGLWRYRDRTAMRSINDMQQIGVPYAGGC